MYMFNMNQHYNTLKNQPVLCAIVVPIYSKICLVGMGISSQFFVLRLERGGEHVIWASCTKTVISRLIYKISRHMTHKNKADA